MFAKSAIKLRFTGGIKSWQVFSEVLDGKLTLQDIVEADETFFPVSYKSKSLGMPRKPRHPGSEVHKRGISTEQVCVSCMGG